MRDKIPKKLEREILFRNQSACCICGKSNVQIHHIDRNENNNVLPNLCVLCIEHHALASSKSSMTKGLSPDLLKKYKSEWEGGIARKRRQLLDKRPKNRFSEEMVKFEIKKVSYGLPAKKTVKEIEEQIDYLYNIHIFEGFTLEIMKKLDYIRWFLPSKHIGRIAPRIYEFYWQFFDPNGVKMWKSDERDLKEAVSLLGGYAICVLTMEPDKKILKNIYNGLLNLLKIAASYRKKQIGFLIEKEVKEIHKKINKDIEGKKVRMMLLKSIQNYEKEIYQIRKKSYDYSIMPPAKLLITEG